MKISLWHLIVCVNIFILLQVCSYPVNTSTQTRIVMSETFLIDENICRQVLSLKLTADTLQAELHKRGIGEEHMAEYLNTIKKMRYENRRSTGFICMAAGAFLGFLSCVLTITHAFPNMYDFIMYGLTSIAVCIVVLGLYYVFE